MYWCLNFKTWQKYKNLICNDKLVFILDSREQNMHVNGWGSPPVLRRTGLSAFASEPRAFPLVASMAKGWAPKLYCNLQEQSESGTLHTDMKNEEKGWRGQTPLASGEPDPGRGNFLSPRRAGNFPNGSFPGIWAVRLFVLPAHRHLGASSPSGNARGGCRGCNPKL